MSHMNSSSLIELIDDTIRRNVGWTDSSIAHEATQLGHKLSRQDINGWRTGGGMTLLSPKKVRALAAGLHLPVYRVALAVLADLGIDVPQDVRTPEDAIHHDHGLSPHAREQLLALLDIERHRSAR